MPVHRGEAVVGSVASRWRAEGPEVRRELREMANNLVTGIWVASRDERSVRASSSLASLGSSSGTGMSSEQCGGHTMDREASHRAKKQ